MAAPPKPWEMAGVNSQNSTASLPPCCQPEARAMPSAITTGGALPQTLNPNPPPIPERPALGTGMSTYGGGLSSYGGYGSSYGSSYGSYGGYGGMYGGGLGGYGGMYGGSMYGGGMYGGGLGGYGSGMYGGGYGMGGDYQPNSFVQQAEASSRQAFESIGSVVQVFGSISMMLDSTFHAVYNSFRAVIGVADQFGRMKVHLTQIFSALAIIRGLKWLVKKVLVLLRLRAAGLPEDAWSQAVAQEGANLLGEGSGGGKNWPIMIFFAMVFAGPWLIWKLLSSFTNSTSGKWADGTCDHFLATAEYDFTGQGEQELSFRRGQKIVVAPKELQPRMRGWLLASVDGKKEGIIPANYVKIMGKRQGQGQQMNPAHPRALQPSPSQAQLPSLNPGVQNNVLDNATDNQSAFDNLFTNSAEMPSPDNAPTCEKSEEKKTCCSHQKD